MSALDTLERTMVSSPLPHRVVVIGFSMTAQRFVERLVAPGSDRTVSVIVFGDEPRRAYNRLRLTSYFVGEDPEALAFQSNDWYTERGVVVHIGSLVVSVDPISKVVTSADGITAEYDSLVLACGSSAFVPPGIDGSDTTRGVFVYRTIEDLDRILAHARSGAVKRACVLGGGLLGLEAADACRQPVRERRNAQPARSTLQDLTHRARPVCARVCRNQDGAASDGD